MTTLLLLASLACPASGREPPRDRVLSTRVYAVTEDYCRDRMLADPMGFSDVFLRLADVGVLVLLDKGTRLRVLGPGPPGEGEGWLAPWVKVRVENGENWGRELFVREGVLEPRKWRYLDR